MEEDKTSDRAQREFRHIESDPTGGWNPGWRTKVLALLVGVIIAALSNGRAHGYGWGGAILSAGAALLVPILAYRRLWGRGRFWTTLALLAALQVPLVIAVRPLVEQFRFAFMLMFGAVDCMVVICAVYWVCLRSDGGKN